MYASTWNTSSQYIWYISKYTCKYNNRKYPLNEIWHKSNSFLDNIYIYYVPNCDILDDLFCLASLLALSSSKWMSLQIQIALIKQLTKAATKTMMATRWHFWQVYPDSVNLYFCQDEVLMSLNVAPLSRAWVDPLWICID